jgi:hypothetical protein
MKKSSEVLRVEIEARSRFLKLYEIRDPYDFTKLVAILPGRHIKFVRINERKLLRRLQRMGFSAEKLSFILDDIKLLEGDVWAVLNYLHQELGLKNGRRLLDSLDVNDDVAAALKEWAAQWPAAPTKLRNK